jgi:thioredoxin 2
MDENLFIKCPACGVKNRIPANRVNDRPRCGRCGTPLNPGSGEPVRVTDSDFDHVVSSANVVLVDCWAPWCGPCRVIGPVVEELARQYAGRAVIGKLNVDENPVTAQRYQVRSIPMLLFFKNGRLVDTLVGAVPAQQIRQKLEALI